MSFFKNANKNLQQTNEKQKKPNLFRRIRPALAGLMSGLSLFVSCEQTFLNNEMRVFIEPKYPKKRIALKSLDSNKYYVIGRYSEKIGQHEIRIVGRDYEIPSQTTIEIKDLESNGSRFLTINIEDTILRMIYVDWEKESIYNSILYKNTNEKVIVLNPYHIVRLDSNKLHETYIFNKQTKESEIGKDSIGGVFDIFQGKGIVLIKYYGSGWGELGKENKDLKSQEVFAKENIDSVLLEITFATPNEDGKMTYVNKIEVYKGGYLPLTLKSGSNKVDMIINMVKINYRFYIEVRIVNPNGKDIVYNDVIGIEDHFACQVSDGYVKIQMKR